jgi:two-component sensor histidine kinase
MIGNANRAEAVFTAEVAARFGLLPNFFRLTAAVPGLTEKLWDFACSAYIDSPLPSLFKERLFVHLSRFCRVRYCIVRHLGFLIGEGNPAGDPEATPQSLDEALTLLRRPIPGAATLDEALLRIEARAGRAELPASGSEAEADLFDALSVIFLRPIGAARELRAVRGLVGIAMAELLLALLAFVHAAHYWTETHPDIAFEPDMVVIMQRHKELSRLLLDTDDAVGDNSGARLQNTLAELSDTRGSLRGAEQRLGRLVERQKIMAAELQHRSRNLLAVVEGIATEIMHDSDTIDAFRGHFGDALAAMSRAQGLLSRGDGHPVTVGTLVRTELTALGGGRLDNRVTLDGPEFVLSDTAAQMLALAIHELGINARKYGALSSRPGQLAVTWRLRGGRAKRRVVLEWVEHDVAASERAAVPVSGYGRRLIEHGLPYSLDATTSYEVGEDGVRCTIDLPIDPGPTPGQPAAG